MNPSTNIQRAVIIVLIVLIFLNLPAYLFWVRPEDQADAGERSRVEELHLQLKRRMTTLTALKEIEHRLDDSKQKYQKFSKEFVFSRTNGTSELLRDLDQMCSQAGLLRNRAIYRQDPESSFGMQRLIVTLPIEGYYSNIRNFINDLESYSRFVIVDSIALVSEREGTGMIRLDVNLSTLFSGQP